MLNSLDPDQDRHSVGQNVNTYLDTNCLQDWFKVSYLYFFTGKFCISCRLLTFYNINILKKLSGTLSECQTVRIKIRTDILYCKLILFYTF